MMYMIVLTNNSYFSFYESNVFFFKYVLNILKKKRL